MLIPSTCNDTKAKDKNKKQGTRKNKQLNFRKCIINTFSIDYHLWKASPRSTLSQRMMVRSSSKRANKLNICTVCLCSPSSRTLCNLAVKPQVTFASLSSPAVMDIRHLRRRSLEIIFIIKCESSINNKNRPLHPLGWDGLFGSCTFITFL